MPGDDKELEVGFAGVVLEYLNESLVNDQAKELEELEDVGGTDPSIAMVLQLLGARLFRRLSNSSLTVFLKSLLS
jgi:hypothetical protein